MAKSENYSALASDPASLMLTIFEKPGQAKKRFPCAIDPFSRTLAAPVTSVKNYLPMSHKIGTNYTLTSKGLYVDVEKCVVRYKDVNDQGTKLDMYDEAAVQPASEAEELAFIKNPTHGDPKRIKVRKDSYFFLSSNTYTHM